MISTLSIRYPGSPVHALICRQRFSLLLRLVSDKYEGQSELLILYDPPNGSTISSYEDPSDPPSLFNWRFNNSASNHFIRWTLSVSKPPSIFDQLIHHCGTHSRASNSSKLFSSQASPISLSYEDSSIDKIIANNWAILDESEPDWKSHAAAIAQSVKIMKERLKWGNLVNRLGVLSSELENADVWKDPLRAGNLSREHGLLMGKVKELMRVERELLDNIEIISLAHEEGETEMESEALMSLLELRKECKEKETEAMLSGEHDHCPCFIEVQAGAGGAESMDWAEMVMQMYKLWAQRRGYVVTMVDEMPGEAAGIKRATLKLEGEYAYGYAKAEAGVHRLVRISPFDSANRRHTSFVAVAVIPILNDGCTRVQINDSDLRIERFRSGGPGGQHANTTESAIRIVHVPTGISATCQSERSQHMNKASALAVLQSRLDALEMARQAHANAQHTQTLTDISWGNQIRTYVLHPYKMVKDLRTNYEVSDPSSVLGGNLDGFIFSYLALCLDTKEDNIES